MSFWSSTKSLVFTYGSKHYIYKFMLLIKENLSDL